MEKIKRILQPRVLIIGIILFANVVGSIALARYIYHKDNAGLVRAQWFYFTSNLLKDETELQYYSLAADTTELSFTLGNHEDNLRASEVGINYTVTVEEGTYDKSTGIFTQTEDSSQVVVKYDDKNGLQLTENEDGTYESKNLDVTVTLTNLASGTYKVTAVGYTGDEEEKGYYKTLTAIIHVEGEKILYKYLDNTNSQYVLLTVWSQGYQGDVTITYPAGLIPDNTDKVMENVKTNDVIIDQTTFSQDGYSSHTYRFFVPEGMDSGDLEVEDFNVSYAGSEAKSKTPD
jgi:hypothetical protein